MSDIKIILKHDVYRDVTVEPINLRNAIYAGDSAAQRIMFRCWANHGSVQPDDLSQKTVTAHFIRPDGGDVVITGVGGADWSYVDLPEACYVYPGIFKLLIRVSSADPDIVTSVMYIVGRIDKPTTDTIIDPGTVIPSLEDLLALIDDCRDATVDAEEAVSYIAPTFDSSEDYDAGDYVIHSGVLYRFDADHTGAWTGTDVTSVSAGGEITAIQEKTAVMLTDTNVYTYVTGKGIRPGTGAEASSSVYDSTDYIDVSGSTKIVFTRPMTSIASPTFGAAFYDTSKAYVDGSGIFIRGNATHVGYELYECEVPSGAKYARFSVWSAASVQTYGITGTFALYDADYYHSTIQGQIATMLKAEADGLGLHSIPPSQGVLNVIKRCRQFTEIEWTPATDLPRAMMVTLTNPDYGPADEYEGVFKAGVTYKGLPYGNCEGYKPAYGYDNTYIGYNIDFGTFVTSVTNPDSMLCQESSHRFEPVHRALVYAAVCSSLACYAINVAYKLTGSIPNITGMVTVGHVIDNGTRMDIDNILRLGDILNKVSYHASVVTDIVRNANGNIEYIEISDATVVGNGNQAVMDGPLGGICRRFAMTVDDFFWRYADFDLLRYTRIDNVPYIKSKWVDVGNEIPMNPLDTLPCMPYEGDGFVYLSGHIPYTKILIACHDYDYLRVFKDGVEMANSPFAVSENDEYIDVGFSAVGEYSAYLCNMSGGANTAMTARCHWSVVQE